VAVLVTALLGFIGIAVAYYVGVRQGRAAEKVLALSLRKAVPRINSRMELARSSPPNRPDVVRYTVHTTIYNDGELVARDLEGDWKLTASHGIQPATNVIRADSLPLSFPFNLEHEIAGDVSVLWCDPQIIFQVDIDVAYLGMNSEKNSYKATYRYDFQNRKMIRQ